jgi:predicted signal transduction protein with EAL and GGDEF domain
MPQKPPDFRWDRYHGDSFKVVTYKIGDDGNKVVLAGATLEFKIATYDQSTPGVTITLNAGNNIATVIVSATLMEALASETSHLFLFRVTYADGFKETWFVGEDYLLKDEVA